MKTWRGAAWAIALLTIGFSGSTAHASWCNAFEVCWHRNQSSSSSYYAPPSSVAYYVAPTTSYYVAPTTSYYVAPTTSYYVAPTTSHYAPESSCPSACAPSCTPCQTCQTNYVQRSYYQPVTEYQSQSYYEKVTTTNTSYYYEPVTSYSYSSYYDACSCSYQQVAKPTVSYQLRAQSCPVDSWVQRCQKVPVTSYKMAYYYEPVTTCSSPPVVAAAPAPACNSCGNTPNPPTAATQQPSYYQPTDTRWQSSPPAGVSESTRQQGQPQQQGQPPTYERSYPPNDKMPSASGSSYQPNRSRPAPVVAPTPAVHLDRFASAPHGQVTGEVVQGNWQPANSSRLVFINAERRESRKEVTTDNVGRFQAQLTSGSWLVYIEDAQGKPVFSRQIDVRPAGGTELVRLVSR